MGELIKFPGKFNKPKEPEEEHTGEEPLKDAENSPAHTLKDNTTGEHTILNTEELEKLTDFFKVMTTVKNTNPSLSSQSQNIELVKQISGYTNRELISWAVEATDQKINQKPRFYVLVAQELHDRIK